MAMYGKTVGPGGSSAAVKKTGCKSTGPGGVAGDTSITTSRGYDSKRTSGLRTEYRESGRAENGKASK
jgi:hypothetical protein